MKEKFLLLLIIFTQILVWQPNAYPLTNEELLKRIETLEDNNARMEKRIKELEAELVKKEAIKKEEIREVVKEEAIKVSEKEPTIIEKFIKEIAVHGFVDTSFIFNTNTPVSPNTQTNNLRIFDREANGFMLNLVEINIEKPISMESPVGFRVDLDYGEDAEVFGAAGLGTTDDEFDLQQAYLQFFVPFSLPFMHELNFRIGKYVTLHGAEVIESVDNWNFSRSFLFGYAIPFTHTGVRLYYKPVEDWPVDGYFGIVNGWDNARDNNRGKTIEAMLCFTPLDELSLTVALMSGPERADSNEDFRNLIDVVATYQVFDKLTVKANFDYGWEANAASVADGVSSQKDASWLGVAGYAKYDILDWWSIAGRGEYFHDRDGVRTGVRTASTPIQDLKLWEFTITNEFKLFNNIIARLEYRYDKASGQAFIKDKVTSNYQNTLAGEIIYKF